LRQRVKPAPIRNPITQIEFLSLLFAAVAADPEAVPDPLEYAARMMREAVAPLPPQPSAHSRG
jgi:hypothetical protein